MLLSRFASRRLSAYGWICHTCIRAAALSSSASTSTSNEAPNSILRKLPSGPARTRFAPSPTGHLHLGSLRTALYNYLLAKATGGQFLLRIEDTDQKRTIPDAEERLCQDLRWAGLKWDEGPDIGGPYGPYKQSERTSLYREHAEKLLRSGDAYRCFCSPERLRAMSKQQTELGLPTGYDRTCTHLSAEESEDRVSKGEPHVIRFRIPSSYPQFKDLVYGRVQNPRADPKSKPYAQTFEDLILVKSDGFPTYHLANVIDDHYMKISHVIRATEWMSSTPKHLALYNAFQWEPPAFAHVGLLTDENGQKLSKRNFHLDDVSSYRDKMDIFPETLTNFVALLGWSHRRGNDTMDLQELVETFDMKFTKGESIVAFEKLWYLQKSHAGRYAASIKDGNVGKAVLMTGPIMEELKRRNLIDGKGFLMTRHRADSHVVNVVRANARVFTTASAFIDKNIYFFQAPDRASLLSSRPSLSLDEVPGSTKAPTIPALRKALSILDFIQPQDWTADTIRTCITSVANTFASDSLAESLEHQSESDDAELILKKAWSKVVHTYIRWALMAGLPSPNSALSMEVLGREETLARLEALADLLDGELVDELESSDSSISGT